jgi:ADP-ribose pyrophosphatase YjhB (NUDIX family)
MTVIPPPSASSFVKDKHCSYCGSIFAEQKVWPRLCFRCGNTTWINPLPVAATILNVWEGNKLGSLIQQRGIDPHKGGWALTGGYINHGETWQQAIVREVREELGLETKEEDYLLGDVQSNTDRSVILLFCINIYSYFMDEIKFVPNNEVTAIKVVHEPVELAFPTHTAFLRERFPTDVLR